MIADEGRRWGSRESIRGEKKRVLINIESKTNPTTAEVSEGNKKNRPR